MRIKDILTNVEFDYQGCTGQPFFASGQGRGKKFRGGAGRGGGEGQNCTGQKCTEHELVLLMFFALKCLDDLLGGFKMRLVGLLWLLVHHKIDSIKKQNVDGSCQKCTKHELVLLFYFNSYLGWPRPLLEL